MKALFIPLFFISTYIAACPAITENSPKVDLVIEILNECKSEICERYQKLLTQQNHSQDYCIANAIVNNQTDLIHIIGKKCNALPKTFTAEANSLRCYKQTLPRIVWFKHL